MGMLTSLTINARLKQIRIFKMKSILSFIAMIGLAGCVSYAEMDPARNSNYIQNSSTGTLCRELAVRAQAYDAGVRYWGQDPHEYGSREALEPYVREFVRRGFNQRDVEIL